MAESHNEDANVGSQDAGMSVSPSGVADGVAAMNLESRPGHDGDGAGDCGGGDGDRHSGDEDIIEIDVRGPGSTKGALCSPSPGRLRATLTLYTSLLRARSRAASRMTVPDSEVRGPPL